MNMKVSYFVFRGIQSYSSIASYTPYIAIYSYKVCITYFALWKSCLKQTLLRKLTVEWWWCKHRYALVEKGGAGSNTKPFLAP